MESKDEKAKAEIADIPKIGDIISTGKALELCDYFGLITLAKRIVDNPDIFKPWKFDGCSMMPDHIVSRLINVPALTEICLKHDLKYAYGEPGNNEERLRADYELGVDLLRGGASAEVSLLFFTGVQAGGGELGLSFSWGFARK